MPVNKKSKWKKPRVSETVEVGGDRVTVVTEVVEDTEEEEGITRSNTPEKAESQTDETEEKPVEPEEVPADAETKRSDEREVSEEENEEKQKQVVEELFRPASHAQMPEITMEERRSKPFIFWAAAVLGIALVVGGGLILVSRGQLTLPAISLTQPTPTVTPPPTQPTLMPLAKNEITLEVLNGGGVPGAASQMKAFLEEKGYTVSDTGNTEEYTYEQTEIHVKSAKEAYLTILEDDISESYTVGTLKATLAESEPYDVRIIVGKE